MYYIMITASYIYLQENWMFGWYLFLPCVKLLKHPSDVLEIHIDNFLNRPYLSKVLFELDVLKFNNKNRL